MTDKIGIYGRLEDFAQEWVELYEFDASKYGLGMFRFYNGTDERGGDIVWQGNTYRAFPIETDGWAMTGNGQLPRPKIRFSNATGVITELLINNNDLVGCQLTRKRTIVYFLDAVNFIDGNPHADPSEHLPDDVYVVSQKTTENKEVVEFELCSPIDLQGVMIPRRQVINNLCTWRYRGEECGYTGGAVADANNKPTNDITKDKCSLRLSGCKMRFGEHGELPFGGFPASGLLPT